MSSQQLLQESEYFFSMIPELLQNLHSLREKCVDKQVALFQAVIQSLRQDGADRGLDYKISGFHVPPNSDEAAPLLDPVENEIVLAKTSSSVFLSTNIDYILRSMKIEHLIMAGCLTDQCVEHAVRDACDLGYLVTLVVDGSLTYSQERHEASLRAVGGYCRHRTVAEMIVELGNI
jgi:ureidoacrylate peracid hydrolase